MPKLLHTGAFAHTRTPYKKEAFRQKRLQPFCKKPFTRKLLHRDAFGKRSFYTQKLLAREAFKQSSFYTQKLCHRQAFAGRNFEHKRCLHTAAFTQRSFCADQLLHSGLFSQRSFYAQRFSHGSYTEAFTRTKALHTHRAFTHRRFYA